jgi:anti-anti-sigma regulatory factor
MSTNPYEFRTEPDREALSVSGEIRGESARRFSADLAREALRRGRPGGVVHLDLDELDLLDGAAVAETVNALREILNARRRLEIHRSPQMLAHTLYKTGMLEDGRVTLIDPVEEGSTAN